MTIAQHTLNKIAAYIKVRYDKDDLGAFLREIAADADLKISRKCDRLGVSTPTYYRLIAHFNLEEVHTQNLKDRGVPNSLTRRHRQGRT